MIPPAHPTLPTDPFQTAGSGFIKLLFLLPFPPKKIHLQEPREWGTCKGNSLENYPVLPRPSLLAGALESFDCSTINQFNGNTVTLLTMRSPWVSSWSMEWPQTSLRGFWITSMFSLHFGEAHGGAGGRKALLSALSVGFALIPFQWNTCCALGKFSCEWKKHDGFSLGKQGRNGLENRHPAALILALSGGKAPSCEHGNLELNFAWICSGSVHP